MFKGRAAEKLTPGLPQRRREELTTCPHEDLAATAGVHLDCYGNVYICQGLSIGNMWQTPLSELVRQYDARLSRSHGRFTASIRRLSTPPRLWNFA